MILDVTDTLVEAVTKISEENPGALTVLQQIHDNTGDHHEFGKFLIFIDIMGFYGWRLWYAYKDIYKNDIAQLMKALGTRDQGLIEIIRKEEKALYN